MAGLFLDTSSLAKLYHLEIGSDRVTNMVYGSGSRCFLSRLTLIEMESVLATKIRTGELASSHVETLRRFLRADITRGGLIVAPPFELQHVSHARELVAQYGVREGLRTLDALQLVSAIHLKRAGQVRWFVSADRRLHRVAGLEGFVAINPEDPSVVLS